MPRTPAPQVLLALVGGALTPVATGLSLQILPFVGPLLLYAAVGFFFALRTPAVSWRAGVWLTLGLLVLIFVVALALLIIESVTDGLRSEYFSGVSSYVWVTLRFTALPALLGGCAGGWIGAVVAQRRRS